MAKEKLLTVREAAAYFGISEKAVVDLSEQGTIPAYKIGGVYLRFKEDQLKQVKITPRVLTHIRKSSVDVDASLGYRNLIERINDFLYFNDFYFLCFFICLTLLLVVFS
ncbi:MAG: helix-turn-helix domain-containing protein [Candidatus Omnitrophica bacterium]|nr:helix-turn-helix domain-containing protein [Candidatus Omnitrophota bacterium]